MPNDFVVGVIPGGPPGAAVDDVEFDPVSNTLTFILDNGVALSPIPLFPPIPDAPTLSISSDLFTPVLTVTRAGHPSEVGHKVYKSVNGAPYMVLADVPVSGAQVTVMDSLSGSQTVEYVATTYDDRGFESNFSNLVTAALMDFFASSVTGSDADSGTSPEEAFATLAALETALQTV